jgi:hypothetical protein
MQTLRPQFQATNMVANRASQHTAIARLKAAAPLCRAPRRRPARCLAAAEVRACVRACHGV